jgi:5-methylcytosine-specific restriction endonuclease McrA
MKRTPIKSARTKGRPGRLYGKDLVDLRERCFLRDGGKCRACEREVSDDVPAWHDAKYHMSHVKAKRMGGDSLANVETLCHKCHRTQHSWGPSGAKPVPKKEPDGRPL